MSAIWGAIAFDNKIIPDTDKIILINTYKGLKIDRYGEIDEPGIYMGCGIQYFNDEAKREALPCKNENIFFNGDIILDNRAELCSKYNLNKALPDGAIFFTLYCRYGTSIFNELVGSYTAAVFDNSKKKLILLDDAVGDRCVFYTKHNNLIIFSTLYEPLVRLTNAPFNDNWFVDFLSMDHMIMNSDSISTPYEGIYRVAPAHYISFTKTDTADFRYWYPVNTVTARRDSDKKIKKQFIELLRSVTADMLRTSGNVSVQLSGGLDSTTVAHFLSEQLKKQDKKLYSYTSVPLKTYKTDSNITIDNEKNEVIKTVDFYKNIIPCFVDIEGENPWNMRHKQLACLEAPYKSVQNVLWMTKCCELAYDNNSRLMFTGAFGNTSISYSASKACFEYLYSHHRYISFFKELFAFGKYNHADKKHMLKVIRQNCRQSAHHTSKLSNTDYSSSFVNSNTFIKTGCEKRLNTLYSTLNGSNDYQNGLAQYIMNELPFRQMGDASTKRSLITGVLQRDITKDKRIIEFCMSLKPSQFYKNGIDRRLICDYLKELLPPHIIEGSRLRRGRQSADIAYRISLDWENIRKQWMDLYLKNADNIYVDCKKAYNDLLSKPDISSYNRFELTRHTYTAIVVEFTANH